MVPAQQAQIQQTLQENRPVFEGTFALNDQGYSALASNLLNYGHCSLAVSELAKDFMLASYYTNAWTFHPSQHQCLMPFDQGSKEPMKTFCNQLLLSVIGHALASIGKSVDNLTNEEKDLIFQELDLDLDRFHFVRNPTEDEVHQTFNLEKHPERIQQAEDCWQQVQETQSNGGSYHTDIEPYFFTMVAALSGEPTKYLPKSRFLKIRANETPLTPGMGGERTLPKNCLNIWMGQSMANLLHGLGVSNSNDLLLRHRAPNTAIDPMRLALIVGASGKSFPRQAV